MPFYEYLCDTCGRTAEHLRPHRERDHPARCAEWGCKGRLALAAHRSRRDAPAPLAHPGD